LAPSNLVEHANFVAAFLSSCNVISRIYNVLLQWKRLSSFFREKGKHLLSLHWGTELAVSFWSVLCSHFTHDLSPPERTSAARAVPYTAKEFGNFRRVEANLKISTPCLSLVYVIALLFLKAVATLVRRRSLASIHLDLCNNEEDGTCGL
jgi:hypothetical protein